MTEIPPELNAIVQLVKKMLRRTCEGVATLNHRELFTLAEGACRDVPDGQLEAAIIWLTHNRVPAVQPYMPDVTSNMDSIQIMRHTVARVVVYLLIKDEEVQKMIAGTLYRLNLKTGVINSPVSR